MKNKSADFACYANSTGADIFAITESWLSERDIAHKAEITLPGYKLLEQQRVGRKGGGIALLLNETIDARKVDSGERRSFEFGEWILKYGSSKLRVIVIYRPPYCKTAFYHLHNIRRIKKYLSRDSLLHLVHAFITSRLDYCNALLYGLPKEQIVKLQRVQNAAARVIMDVGKYSHITPILCELHSLPVQARIQF